MDPTDPTPPRSRTDALRLHLLVVRCQAGDERAFAALLERFGARTLRYLRGLVGDDAEDVHQEVWLDVYRRVGQLATPAAFVGWLFRVARHRAVDWLRRRRRERELLDDVVAERLAQDDAADAPPDAAWERWAAAPELAAAIAALPAPQREVLLLRYEGELRYEEIALLVGCSVGTVKSRLHHARRRLQDAVAPSVAPPVTATTRDPA